MELTTYDLTDGIATITLANGKHNALSPALSASIHETLDRAEQDEAVVLLTAEGGSFCAGLDLRADDFRAMAADALTVSRRLLSFPRPTALACNGHALAMGAFLLLSCDVRIGAAGPHKIGLNEVAVELTFPASGLKLAAHRLTVPAYDRCLITGEVLDPEGAAAAGFLDTVVSADELILRARVVAERLRTLDVASHVTTKLEIRRDVLAAIDAQVERLRVDGGGW